MPDKPIVWLGTSLEDLRSFPRDGRERAGRALRLVQEGGHPPDWKPFPSIGVGVNEVRVRTGREFRIFYVYNLPRAVYVLHAFEKKSRQTLKADVQLARNRLKSLRDIERKED